MVSDGKKVYVLKQIHYEPCGYYQFENKIELETNDYHKLKRIGITKGMEYQIRKGEMQFSPFWYILIS